MKNDGLEALISRRIEAYFMGLLEFGLVLVGLAVLLALLFFIADAKIMEQIFGNFFIAGFACACIIGMIYMGLFTASIKR